MGRATRAVAAAETGERHLGARLPAKAFDKRAFLAAGRQPKGEDPAGRGQMIDVPMHGLLAFQVTAQPGPQAAGAIGTAAVGVTARLEGSSAERGCP